MCLLIQLNRWKIMTLNDRGLKGSVCRNSGKTKTNLKTIHIVFFSMGCAAALVCIVHHVSSVTWFIKHWTFMTKTAGWWYMLLQTPPQLCEAHCCRRSRKCFGVMLNHKVQPLTLCFSLSRSLAHTVLLVSSNKVVLLSNIHNSCHRLVNHCC